MNSAHLPIVVSNMDRKHLSEIIRKSNMGFDFSDIPGQIYISLKNFSKEKMKLKIQFSDVYELVYDVYILRIKYKQKEVLTFLFSLWHVAK